MDILETIQDHNFSDNEITEIISKELPTWKEACDKSTADAALFHQDAFGRSTKELLLMALAIKYAKVKGKHIKIIS